MRIYRVCDVPVWRSGGYTYLNRDVPLMFDPYVPEIHLKGAPFPLRYTVERDGGPVSQLRSPYSHLIAEAAHRPPGFTPVACFPSDSETGEAEMCLFRRRGGCPDRRDAPPVGGKRRSGLIGRTNVDRACGHADIFI